MDKHWESQRMVECLIGDLREISIVGFCTKSVQERYAPLAGAPEAKGELEFVKDADFEVFDPEFGQVDYSIPAQARVRAHNISTVDGTVSATLDLRPYVQPKTTYKRGQLTQVAQRPEVISKVPTYGIPLDYVRLPKAVHRAKRHVMVNPKGAEVDFPDFPEKPPKT